MNYEICEPDGSLYRKNINHHKRIGNKWKRIIKL